MSTPSAANTALAEAKMPVQYHFAAAQEMRLAPAFRKPVFDRSRHYIGPKYGGMKIKFPVDYLLFVRDVAEFWALDRRVQCGLAHIGYDPETRDDSSVTLVVEGVAIRMDRHIIISGSGFFDGAFNGFYMENDLQEVHLNDVSLKSMYMYLRIATNYFFQRLAQEELPTGELYYEWAKKRCQQHEPKFESLDVPFLEPAQILSIAVLADRFLHPSLFNFCLQLFLEALAATNEAWQSARQRRPDTLCSTDQIFLRLYLDAYRALCLGLDFENTYRQIIIESFDFVACYDVEASRKALQHSLQENSENVGFYLSWQAFCPNSKFKSLRLWALAKNDLRTDADTTAEENGDKKFRRNQVMSLIESRNVEYYPSISWGLTKQKMHEIDERIKELNTKADRLHIPRALKRPRSHRKRKA